MDEAGNLTFAPQGSRYYVFAVAWTYDPAPLAADLARLRFGLNKAGYGIYGFHANPDPQPRRTLVFNVLRAHQNWKYAAVVVEKRKVHPSLYPPERFYPKFASMPLHLVLGYRVRPGTNHVMIYTGLMPVEGKPRPHIEAAIKLACRSHLAGHIPFHICHHPTPTNGWLQVADYCAWAIQRKWEFGNQNAYTLLQSHLAAPELNALRHGTAHHY